MLVLRPECICIQGDPTFHFFGVLLSVFVFPCWGGGVVLIEYIAQFGSLFKLFFNRRFLEFRPAFIFLIQSVLISFRFISKKVLVDFFLSSIS